MTLTDENSTYVFQIKNSINIFIVYFRNDANKLSKRTSNFHTRWLEMDTHFFAGLYVGLYI